MEDLIDNNISKLNNDKNGDHDNNYNKKLVQ